MQFSYSLARFDNAFTLVNISEADIEYVRQLITSKLLDIIINKLDPVLFFGEYFAETPDRFEFTIAEKMAVIEISKYISKIKQEKTKELSQPEKKEKPELQNTVYSSYACGWFFKKKKRWIIQN